MKSKLIKLLGGFTQEELINIRCIVQQDFCEKIKTYHENYNKNQEILKQKFDYSKLEKININIWDDFKEGESTYAYVEHNEIPDFEIKKILGSLKKYIVDNSLLPSSVGMELVFYDSLNKYPDLLIKHESALYKRYELRFTGTSYEVLEKLIDNLRSLKEINGVTVDIYSES